MKSPNYGCKSNFARKGYLFVKRILDILISAIMLLVSLPIFIVVALIIKIDDHGPIFYKHRRIGKEGKIIYLYKFRSMIVNAEEKMKEFTTEQKKEFEKNFKLENDPRITKIGKILRKTCYYSAFKV